MATEFSLLTLKNTRHDLLEKKNSIENDDGRWHLLEPKRELTKIIHQVADLDFSIELLETWED